MRLARVVHRIARGIECITHKFCCGIIKNATRHELDD
jgi:hypothetical protein